MSARFAALTLALLTACAARSAPAPMTSAEPADPLREDAARSAEVEETLDRALASPVLDCPEATRLRDEICRLADQICGVLTRGHELCDDARARCERARGKVGARCPGPG